MVIVAAVNVDYSASDFFIAKWAVSQIIGALPTKLIMAAWV